MCNAAYPLQSLGVRAAWSMRCRTIPPGLARPTPSAWGTSAEGVVRQWRPGYFFEVPVPPVWRPASQSETGAALNGPRRRAPFDRLSCICSPVKRAHVGRGVGSGRWKATPEEEEATQKVRKSSWWRWWSLREKVEDARVGCCPHSPRVGEPEVDVPVICQVKSVVERNFYFHLGQAQHTKYGHGRSSEGGDGRCWWKAVQIQHGRGDDYLRGWNGRRRLRQHLPEEREGRMCRRFANSCGI